MARHYALGSITAERYQSISAKYEQELKQVRERLGTLIQTISERENQTENNIRFLESIQKYTDVEEITRSMLVELVDKIVIFNGEGKGKNRQQQIDIYYRFSGIVDVNEG
jgi:maltodextrin utilization protein YvdJ